MLPDIQIIIICSITESLQDLNDSVPLAFVVNANLKLLQDGVYREILEGGPLGGKCFATEITAVAWCHVCRMLSKVNMKIIIPYSPLSPIYIIFPPSNEFGYNI